GIVPSDMKGYGYGDGYGYGSGSGYGDGSGYGSSSGYGYGYGAGSSDGYGHGYGSGSGSGYVSGDGAGSSSGDGSGDGAGSSSGYGYGAGSSDGSGYGYGYGSLRYAVMGFVSGLGRALQKRAKLLIKQGATLSYWKSDVNGQPCNNGGNIEAAAPGVVHESKGPLNLCSSGTLHATWIPSDWKGTRLWLVAMIGKTVTDEKKIGALKREIIAEITPEKP